MKPAGLVLVGVVLGVTLMAVIWQARSLTPIATHDFQAFTRDQLKAAGAQVPGSSTAGDGGENYWTLDVEGDPTIAQRVFHDLRSEVQRVVISEKATIHGSSNGSPPRRFSLAYHRGFGDGHIYATLVVTGEARSVIIFVHHEAR